MASSRMVERTEAKLRLVNCETMRRKLWTLIAAQLKTGQLTEKEAEQQPREFWADRHRDTKLARWKTPSISEFFKG